MKGRQFSLVLVYLAVIGKAIIDITGAMENANCEINNPLGRCCSSIIKQTIKKAMNKIG